MKLLGKDMDVKQREEDGRYVFEVDELEMVTLMGEYIHLSCDSILGVKEGDVIDVQMKPIRLFVTGVTDGVGANRELRRKTGAKKQSLVVGKKMNVKLGG